MSPVKAAGYGFRTGGAGGGPLVTSDAAELEGAEFITRQVAPGLWARLPVVFEYPDHNGLVVRMVLDFTDEGIRPVAVSVMNQDGSPVTGQTLRSVRLGEVFQNAAAYVIHVGEVGAGGPVSLDPVGHPAFRLAGGLTAEQESNVGRQGASEPEFMERIAALYSAATTTGLPPQRFIMDVYNAPRSTAGYWISQARKRGYLPPVGGDDAE